MLRSVVASASFRISGAPVIHLKLANSVICRKPFCQVSLGSLAATCSSLRWAVSGRSVGTIARRGREVSRNSDGNVVDPSPAPHRASIGRQNETFLSDKSITWSSLGLSAEVSDALLMANLSQPSLVQVFALPSERIRAKKFAREPCCEWFWSLTRNFLRG